MFNFKAWLSEKKANRKIILGLIFCCIVCGCNFKKVHDQNFGSVNFLEEGKLKQELLNNKLKQSDVLTKIGAPSLIDKDSNGLENWYYVNTTLASTPFYQKKFAQFIVVVKFDKQSLVENIYLTEKLGDNSFSKSKISSDAAGKIYLKNIVRRLILDTPDKLWK